MSIKVDVKNDLWGNRKETYMKKKSMRECDTQELLPIEHICMDWEK